MPFHRVNKRRRPGAAQLSLHPVPVRGVRQAPELHAKQYRRQIPVEKIQQPPGPLPLLQMTNKQPCRATGAEHHYEQVYIEAEDAKADEYKRLFRWKAENTLLLIKR
ncbi:hypothetical protein WB91_22055 [bacteria symbiont BFo1 of Frankliniella occidentalis]|nr:hypothetical protein WB91_22055 [bacteria symbiont BFo1 of Frankliniella occidentalis]